MKYWSQRSETIKTIKNILGSMVIMLGVFSGLYFSGLMTISDKGHDSRISHMGHKSIDFAVKHNHAHSYGSMGFEPN